MLYRIVNEKTGLMIQKVNWLGDVTWATESETNCRDIESINSCISIIVKHGRQSILENCKIQAYQRKYLPAVTRVKLGTILAKHEKLKIIDILTNG